jgi:hypothetical protein
MSAAIMGGGASHGAMRRLPLAISTSLSGGRVKVLTWLRHPKRSSVMRSRTLLPLNTCALAMTLTLPLLAPGGAHAAFDGECRIYAGNDTGMPARVQTLLTQRRDAAGYACVMRSGDLVSYAPVSAIIRGRQGVCAFQIRPALNANGQPIGTGFAETFMSLSGGVCPAYRDASYLPANFVSEGVFAELYRFAGTILESEMAFAAAEVPSLSADAAYQEARRELVTRPATTRLRLNGIDLSGFLHSYNLRIGNPANPNAAYTITVDYIEGQPKIVGLQKAAAQ